MPPTVIVSLNDKLFRRIMTLVDSGAYESIQEFLVNAAHNQIALDESNNGVAEAVPSLPVVPRTIAPKPVVRSAEVDEGRESGLASALERLRLPSSQWQVPRVRPAQAIDGRIWGQVNRVSPVKVAVRAIAVANIDGEQWRTIANIAKRIVTDVATIGTALEQADKRAGRKRDDLLATGFPRLGNDQSCDRYVQQYIGRLTRADLFFPGAMYQFGLATLWQTNCGNQAHDPCVLTDLGVEFAKIENPILDGDPSSAQQTLSDEERIFFIKRVLPHVAAELADIHCVLRAVDSGKNTPSQVMSALAEIVDASWNAVMLRTHVSGLVARMVELGLLTRAWEGRMVKYDLSPLAREVPALSTNENGAQTGVDAEQQ